MFPDLMRDDVFRLETSRLWLRWPRAADAARIAEYASDREVASMTAQIPHPYPPGAAAEFVLTARAGNLAGTQIVVVITSKQRPNEALGCVGLSVTGEDEATLGYWLARPRWGQGLMREAVCALTGLAISATRLNSIIANARADNAASRRVLETVGFIRDGYGVESAPARGGSLVVERWRLSRADWNGCEEIPRRELDVAQAR